MHRKLDQKVNIKASVSTKINGWATLAYEYKALKQPQVLDKFQIQQGVVLNISYAGYLGLVLLK